MTTTITAIVISLIFVAVAAKNWTKVIGAGPTILIVGALVLFGFWAYNYTSDQDDQRAVDTQQTNKETDYAACVAKVDRSIGNRAYNLFVISLLQHELPGRPDLAEQLTTELDRDLPKLSLEHDCPPNPNP